MAEAVVLPRTRMSEAVVPSRTRMAESVVPPRTRMAVAEAVVPPRTRMAVAEAVVTPQARMAEAVVPPRTRTRWRRPWSRCGRGWRWRSPWSRRGRVEGYFFLNLEFFYHYAILTPFCPSVHSPSFKCSSISSTEFTTRPPGDRWRTRRTDVTRRLGLW